MSEPSIRVASVDDLLPDAANVRRRDERAKATIANSITQFGPARSIVIDSKSIVRAGNGTLEGFAANGGSEVLIVRPGPGQLVAVERDDWSPTEATAYAIADNHIAELATWDAVGLAEQLRSLESENFSLDAVGFTSLEIDALCETGADAILDDEAWPEIQAPDFHSIVVRYREEDVEAILAFLETDDRDSLTTGHAGKNLLERIREIAADRANQAASGEELA